MTAILSLISRPSREAQSRPRNRSSITLPPFLPLALFFRCRLVALGGDLGRLAVVSVEGPDSVAPAAATATMLDAAADPASTEGASNSGSLSTASPTSSQNLDDAASIVIFSSSSRGLDGASPASARSAARASSSPASLATTLFLPPTIFHTLANSATSTSPSAEN